MALDRALHCISGRFSLLLGCGIAAQSWVRRYPWAGESNTTQYNTTHNNAKHKCYPFSLLLITKVYLLSLMTACRHLRA